MEKLLKLALLHDLEEAITGDLTPQDKASKGEKVVQDQKAAAREQILSHLPQTKQRAYRRLWGELESEKSAEGRLVYELDKMELALQANQYSKQGIEATRLKEFYESSRTTIKDPRLKLVLEETSRES